MAHLDYLFPVCFSASEAGGPETATVVAVDERGYRQAIATRPHPLYSYNVVLDNREIAEYEQVRDLFNACIGPAHTFDYQDRLENQSCAFADIPAHDDQPLGTGDGVETSFQPVKRYTVDTASTDRPVQRLVSGEILVGIDGINQAAGWTWNSTTKRIVFDTPPANLAVLTWGGSFYVPVAFSSNQQMTTISGVRRGGGDYFVGTQVTLIEVVLQ